MGGLSFTGYPSTLPGSGRPSSLQVPTLRDKDSHLYLLRAEREGKICLAGYRYLSVRIPSLDAPAPSSSSSSSSSSPPSSSFTRSHASLRSILICSWLIFLDTVLL